MRIYKYILFLVFFLTASQSFAICKDPVRSLLGLLPEEVGRVTSEFNCTDILYLRKKGFTGISFSEYKKLFPEGADFSDLIKNGFTPDKASLVTAGISNLFDSLKKEYQEMHSVVFKNNKFKADNGNGLSCSSADFSNLSTLPETMRPAYFSGNQIFNAFKEQIGQITPLKDGKALFKMGLTEKEIPWENECYQRDTMASVVNALTSCWLCPVYDFFFKAVSQISYLVWHTMKKPLLILIGILFPLMLLFRILFHFIDFEEEEKGYIKNKILPRLLAVSAVTLIILPDASYDIIAAFIQLILEPIANFMTYLSSTFLPNQTCDYMPLSFDSSEYLFSATIKNDLLCIVEKLLGVFMDYVVISAVVILKSFGILISWDTINVFNPIGQAQVLLTFLFTFLLGVGLILSFLKQMFQVLFYMIDPIFNMGMVFLFLPFVLLQWVLGDDLKVTTKTFTQLFQAIINGFFIMAFTSLMVAFSGGILLGLLTSSEHFSALKDALASGNFGDIWSAVDLESAAPLRIIVGIMIVDKLMGNIPNYASDYLGIEISDKVSNTLRTSFNETYVNGRKHLTDFREKIKAIGGKK
ncbi:MAG: hypothetical protein JXR30_02650 [Alphaproteobacteria bacterium]|nr:hypothetical protein [Alphaproteobacteria bacterium]